MNEHVKYLYYHILINNLRNPFDIKIKSGGREYITYLSKYRLLDHRGKSYIQKVKKAMKNERDE